MLLKLFGTRKDNPPVLDHVSSNTNSRHISVEESPSILKIIHVGCIFERYYMAYPAARIMEKYPNFLLARPEVFRQPWDSVVRPEEILVPGQKYFMVPKPTIKKLCRRIRKPSINIVDHSYLSKCSSDVSTDSFSNNDGMLSSKSFFHPKPEQACNPHVSFIGIDCKKKKNNLVSIVKKGSNDGRIRVRQKRVRFSESWQPSLTIIDENRGSCE